MTKEAASGRMRIAFTNMLSSCPDKVTAYGVCVMAGLKGKDLNQGDCKKEFRDMAACFQKSKRK